MRKMPYFIAVIVLIIFNHFCKEGLVSFKTYYKVIYNIFSLFAFQFDYL